MFSKDEILYVKLVELLYIRDFLIDMGQKDGTAPSMDDELNKLIKDFYENASSSSSSSSLSFFQSIYKKRMGNMYKHDCSISRTNFIGNLEISKMLHSNSCLFKEDENIIKNFEAKKRTECLIASPGERESCILSAAKSEVDYSVEEDQVINVFENSYRARIPAKKDTWLSSRDIVYTMEQYELAYKHHFVFVHVLPLDFLSVPKYKEIVDRMIPRNEEEVFWRRPVYYNVDKSKVLIYVPLLIIGYIINLDKHGQGGSHWVSVTLRLSINPREGNLESVKFFYFDSAKNNVIPPEIREFHKYVKDNLPPNTKYSDIHYSKFKKQFNNSECGMFSQLNVIKQIHFFDPDEVWKDFENDPEVQMQRKFLFREMNTKFNPSQYHKTMEELIIA